MEQAFNKNVLEKTPGEKFLEQDYLTAGRTIKLVKVFNKNESIEGILDMDVKLGKPIIMDGGLKNIDPILDVKLNEDKIFLKTINHTYELVPPTNAIEKTKLNSKELIEKDKEIEKLLKEAQFNALSVLETRALFKKKQELSVEPQTQDIKKRIEEVETKLKQSTVIVETLLEFKMLMEKMGKNYYIIRSVIEHENAHSNKASSLEAIHGGYSVIVSKNERGGFSYQPTALTGTKEEWSDRKKIETNIKIASAPEEYGDRMSDSDYEQVAKMKKRLGELY